jgi:hypothetical protein
MSEAVCIALQDIERPQSDYVTVPFPDGRGIAFRYDVARDIVEIQRRGVKYFFDLAVMRNRKGERNE